MTDTENTKESAIKKIRRSRYFNLASLFAWRQKMLRIDIAKWVFSRHIEKVTK